MTPRMMKILVMDDEEMVRQVLGEMLRFLKHEVDFSADGSEAVEMYRSALQSGCAYDAVIMDLTVPGGMGGKEAVAELRKIDPGIKAIVSSGYCNDPVMSNYTNYGFCGVVVKPYKIVDLSAQLGMVLDL